MMQNREAKINMVIIILSLHLSGYTTSLQHFSKEHHCNTHHPHGPTPHKKRVGDSREKVKFLELANCYTVPLLFLALVKFLAFSTSRLAFFTSKFSFFSNISSVCKHIKKVSSTDSSYKNSLKYIVTQDL